MRSGEKPPPSGGGAVTKNWATGRKVATKPIDPDDVWAGAIKKDIKAGTLPGTAGGQASPVTLEVLNPLPAQRKSVNFAGLRPRSRWT
jgi:hypothetical protein